MASQILLPLLERLHPFQEVKLGDSAGRPCVAGVGKGRFADHRRARYMQPQPGTGVDMANTEARDGPMASGGEIVVNLIASAACGGCRLS